MSCSIPNSRQAFYNEVILEEIGDELDQAQIHGEWMGLLRVSGEAIPRLREIVKEMCSGPDGKVATVPVLLGELVRRGEKIRVLYSTGHWLDVDTLDDILAAGSFG